MNRHPISCISWIRRFVSQRGEGKPFATAECLIYGSRAAVDQSLSRLVNQGFIVRLARGVFMLDRLSKFKPTVQEVAAVKAHAFGKRIAEHGFETARRLGFFDSAGGPGTHNVAASGWSSSFRYGESRIRWHPVRGRLLTLGSTDSGQVISALLHLGKHGNGQMLHGLGSQTLARVVDLAFQPGPYRFDFPLLRHWMPAWLGEHFVQLRLPACVAFGQYKRRGEYCGHRTHWEPLLIKCSPAHPSPHVA